MPCDVAVIGSGVSGLSTALALAEHRRDLRINVLHDVDPIEITSSGPPGFFRPYKPEFTHWTQPTCERLRFWTSQYPATTTGVHLLSGWRFEDDLNLIKKEEVAGRGQYLNYRYLSQDELAELGSPKKHAAFFTTWASHGRYFVPFLMEQLKEFGCRFEQRKVHSFSELSGKYDFVINASGLGSAELAGDPNMQPNRGVLIEIDAPWLRHFYYTGPTYIIPGATSMFIGGTRQPNRFDRTVTDVDRRDIWQRCVRLLPTIKDCATVSEWCGLRPYRYVNVDGVMKEMPRVEFELISTQSGPLKVIHNYGHGPAGFVLSWGCAQNVTKLFDETQRQHKM